MRNVILIVRAARTKTSFQSQTRGAARTLKSMNRVGSIHSLPRVVSDIRCSTSASMDIDGVSNSNYPSDVIQHARARMGFYVVVLLSYSDRDMKGLGP